MGAHVIDGKTFVADLKKTVMEEVVAVAGEGKVYVLGSLPYWSAQLTWRRPTSGGHASICSSATWPADRSRTPPR